MTAKSKLLLLIVALYTTSCQQDSSKTLNNPSSVLMNSEVKPFKSLEIGKDWISLPDGSRRVKGGTPSQKKIILLSM